MQSVRVKGMQIILEDNLAQSSVIQADRVKYRSCAIHNHANLYVRATFQQQTHTITGHIAIRPAGEFDAEHILMHINAQRFLQGHFGKANHPNRGNAVFLVINTHLFARHNARTEHIAALNR